MAAQPADVAEGDPAGREGTPETSPSVPWRGAVIIVCLAVLPFATFLATNRNEGVRLGQVVPYGAIVVVAGLVAVGVAWAIRGACTADRVAVAAGAAWFLTVNYGAVSGVIEGTGLRARYQLLGWGILTLALVVGAWRLSARPAVRLWCLLFAVLLTAVPVMQVAEHRLSVSEARPASAAASVTGLERTPDIYYVVPDGYGNAGVLQAVAGLDNSSFLDMLENRGFVVAHNAYSNYPTTFLSVASTLQMDYVVEPGPDALAEVNDGENADRSVFYGMIQGDSTVVETLRDAGYRYVHAPPGTWNGSACSGREDLCIEPLSESGAGVVLGEVEWALLQMTPAADVLGGLGESFDDVSSDPVHTVREIEDQRWDEPVFAFIHMMHPHPPFPFDAQCRPRDTGGHDIRGWPRDTESAYAAGVQCTNRRLEAMIDVLPRDAVVVIQADHGSNYLGAGGTPVDEWTATHIEERLGILSAVRLPEDCRDMVDDRFGGVNTFRVILACLSGDDPEPLPSRHMLANYRETAVREVDAPAGESLD